MYNITSSLSHIHKAHNFFHALLDGEPVRFTLTQFRQWCSKMYTLQGRLP